MDQNKNNPWNKGKRQLQVDTKVIKPFSINESNKELKINPFYIIEDHPNDANRFAILRTTENGKYVRGGMLFFNYKGIEIYTDINNAIFIDTINNTIFIKEYEKVVEEITPKDPEQRQYILLMSCVDQDSDSYIWASMDGRTTAYKYIVDNIDAMNIDPEKSFVLVETVPYKDALSVANFVRYLKNAELVEDDGFDIEEWLY